MDAKYLALGGLGLLGVLALRGGKSKKDSKRKTTLASAQAGPKTKAKRVAPKRPDFCRTGEIDEKATEVLMNSFDRAWAASGYEAGGFATFRELSGKAHNIALRVLKDLCPNMPRPSLEKIDLVKKRQPKGYKAVYSTVYDWAMQRLTGA